MIRRRKGESFQSMMRAFDRQDHRYGNVRDIMKPRRRFHIGPSKRRQLKSKDARKRSRAIKRRRYRKPRNYHYRSNFY